MKLRDLLTPEKWLTSSFEAYSDPDYYQKIIFDFFPKIWWCGARFQI